MTGSPRATDVERARLNETFAALCAIRSVTGSERAIADHVSELLRDELGLEVVEDATAPLSGAGAGNLLARIPGRSQRSAVLCTHLDTVPHDGVVEPVCDDGVWTSARDTILGADNKAAVAVVLEIARRSVREPPPVGLELLFTVAEEDSLAGSRAFDASVLRSEVGYVFDDATPIGGVVIASPTLYRLRATFHGRAAHAGLRPEDGRSAVLAAARAVAAMPHGRLDDGTTANVGSLHGGVAGTNVVPEHAALLAEARGLDETRAEAVVAAMVDAVHEAANEPDAACDLDLDVERLFAGYRHAPSLPAVRAAEAALRACGFEPRRITSGGGSDANSLVAAGLPCVNVANGTERNHRPDERVSVLALESMLDVVGALLAELGGASA